MSEKQAQTLAEKWEAFMNAEDDYIGGSVTTGLCSLEQMSAVFRKQAHGIYLSRVRAGIWNQQEALNAWGYYLEHDNRMV